MSSFVSVLCFSSFFLSYVCVSSPVKKSSITKSLQFDPEPQREGGTETQSSERPVPSSLLPLIGQLAETAEDKYRLLEQRDKILRQGEAIAYTNLLLTWIHFWLHLCVFHLNLKTSETF